MERGEESFRETDMKDVAYPFDEIEVVENSPSENGKCININDPLIAFANRQFRKAVKFNVNEDVPSDYGTPMDSLKEDGGLEISFHRTIRMPDDDKLHQLPGSLGTFPLFNVSAYTDHLPDKIVQQGGVFLPMWQREALWIGLNAPYGRNYALRVFVGRINAVSGLAMDEKADEMDGTDGLQDYVVVPGQEWLDGICVAPGIVRQFVAMPCTWKYVPEASRTSQRLMINRPKSGLRIHNRRPKDWRRETRWSPN